LQGEEAGENLNLIKEIIFGDPNGDVETFPEES
jgi:hypothetical protein